MVFFTAHARDKIISRGIEAADVLEVLAAGEVIRYYPDDKPYPSRLILGFIGQPPAPLHVVAATDDSTGTVFIVTAYHPDPARWTPDFKTKLP